MINAYPQVMYTLHRIQLSDNWSPTFVIQKDAVHLGGKFFWECKAKK